MAMVNYVVIGGGIAGVCCAEDLCRTCPNDSVTLVAATRILKGVSTVAQITKTLEELQIVEKDLEALPYPNLRWVQGTATDIDTENRILTILLHNNRTNLEYNNNEKTSSTIETQALPYDKVCICTGATPRRLLNSPHVVVLRDTDSVEELAEKLKYAKKVMVVGNGGIALELAHALHGVDVTWVVRHGHIGDAFFDLDAAQFLLEELQRARQGALITPKNLESQKLTSTSTAPVVAQHEEPESEKPASAVVQGVQTEEKHGKRALGHAVGPAWTRALINKQKETEKKESGRDGGDGTFSVEMGCEVIKIKPATSSSTSFISSPSLNSDSTTKTSTTNLEVSLSDGRTLPTDVVISVIGVDPAVEWVPACIARSPKDHGLVVDDYMETSVPNVYAAGDACSMMNTSHSFIRKNNDGGSGSGGGGGKYPTIAPSSSQSSSPFRAHWFQMRLWSQARAQGIYAAHCMAGIQDQTGSDMAFEVFTHVTRFLGKKVVLLGLYNGQKLENESESDFVSYSRVTEEGESGSGHHGHCCRPGRKEEHDGGRTFVRVLLLRGKVQGAVLIGETDLEETMENLILDGLDVGAYGPDLLDPEIELDHIFD